MTPAQAELARKLVALPGWGWRQGLVLTTPGYGADLVRDVDGYGNPSVYGYDPACGEDLLRGVCADLDDPEPEELAETGDTLVDLTSNSTAGVLLGMLAATGRLGPFVPLYSEVGGILYWRVTVFSAFAGGNVRPASEMFEADTLGEAVAAALVAVGRCA